MNKILQTSLLLISILILKSCGPPEFEKNTRILAKGLIQNQDGDPLSEIEVSVYTSAYNGGFYVFGSNQDDYLLGNGFSSASGLFSVTSLFDKDDDFYIYVNGGDDYSSYIYKTSTEDYTPNDLTFDLGTITLEKFANVQFQITNNNPSETPFYFSFTYKDKNCLEIFEEGVLDISQNFCHIDDVLGFSINENSPQRSGEFTTLLGSEVTIYYTNNDDIEVTETILIDQENFTYEFTF